MVGTMLTLPLLVLLAASPFPDFPSATITNGRLTAKLYLPDAVKGYYRATRFDWSGQIGSLRTARHEYFGQWFDRYDPKLHDAIQGPVEEFNPDGVGLGYEEAAPGGIFIRVGVGAVRKPDNKPYERFKTYDIVDPGAWKVKASKDHISFEHSLQAAGFAYRYIKTIRLSGQDMIIEHELRNTGAKPLALTQYNHQFFVMDGQPTGPQTQVTFPFALQARRALPAQLASVQGQQISYARELEKGESVFSNLEGFGSSATDYDIQVGRKDTGAQVRIRGDRPLSQLVFWSIRTTVCPEPYVRLDTAPRHRTRWSYRYTFE